jgi:quercetin dioxygenase-like cupin family protein
LSYSRDSFFINASSKGKKSRQILRSITLNTALFKKKCLPCLDKTDNGVCQRAINTRRTMVTITMSTSNPVDLIGKIVNPAELIAYQDGTVVSRTIVFQKYGTITLFAFDVNEGLSEHTAPFDAIAQVLDGKVEITIAGEIFDLEQGQMIIMPANRPHALKALTKFKMMLTMIHA